MMASPQRREPAPACARLRARQQVRVALGVTLALALIALALAASAAVGRRWPVMLLDLSTAAAAGGALLRIRRTRAVRGPVGLLLGWAFALLVFSGLTAQGLSISVSPWIPLLALLALYMLGKRHGAVFFGVGLLQIAASLYLHRTGATLDMHFLADWDAPGRVMGMAMGIALLGLLGYLYETGQQQAQDELGLALQRSEHDQRQLEAVFESAADAICALDRDGRILRHNRAFARLLVAPGAPAPGVALAQVLDSEQHARWQPHLERAFAGAGASAFEEPPPAGQDAPHRETMIQPMRRDGRVTGVTVLSRDITERKRAEAQARRLGEDLVRASRQAGMAAVASEVLHNAGNVLNSAGVSVSLLERDVHRLRSRHLTEAVALIDANLANLDAFLREDARGQRLIAILRGLADGFELHKQRLATEVGALGQSIDHLTRVLHAQRGHARALGMVETVTVAELVDAALDLHAPSWAQLGIAIERDVPELPALHIDKHKVIEILVNLISNARHALRDSGRPDKRLRVRAAVATPSAGSDGGSGTAAGRVRIDVEDNGVGIAPAHREQLFRLGFTTKADGTGIGLHASANLAQQLGGALSVRSDGPGQGAVFTLELPLVPTGEAPGRPLA